MYISVIFGFLFFVKMSFATYCADIASADVSSVSGDSPAINKHDNAKLIWAANEGHIEIVRLLLDKINAQDRRGINAQNRRNRTALQEAVITDNINIVGLILDEGADVDAQDEAGFTALILATMRNNAAIVDLLLDRGADINARTIFGFTALDLANHNQEVKKIFIS